MKTQGALSGNEVSIRFFAESDLDPTQTGSDRQPLSFTEIRLSVDDATAIRDFLQGVHNYTLQRGSLGVSCDDHSLGLFDTVTGISIVLGTVAELRSFKSSLASVLAMRLGEAAPPSRSGS